MANWFLSTDSALFLMDDDQKETGSILRINADGMMLSGNGIEGPYRYLHFEGVEIEGITKSFSGRLCDV